MGDLSYLKNFEDYADWMAQMGYEGQVWTDRLLKPLDKYEHPQRGLTYTQAYDLVEYINSIAEHTGGLALITGRTYLWVNYAAQDSPSVTRYAPVEAFPSMNWGDGLYDFAVMLVSSNPEDYAGPEILRAKALMDKLKIAPQSVVMDVLAKHGSGIGSMLAYSLAGDAAVRAFRTAWSASVRSVNPE